MQALIVGIAAGHYSIEVRGYITQHEDLHFVPISLFLVPILYSAVYFGFRGAVATALWVVVITLPNVVLFHTGSDRWGEGFQLAVLLVVAGFVGQRADLEHAARKRAEGYAAYVLQGQEMERQRIARDLHDDTIQSLVMACRSLDSAKGEGSHLVEGETVAAARSTIEHVVRGLRDFAKSLRPAIIDDLGMVASIRRLVMDFGEHAKVEGEIKVVGEARRLPADVELGMFRIAQEALWNVEHHANASEVTLTIVFEYRDVTLEVLDNGVGFTVPHLPNDLTLKDHMGLISMWERADLLRGRLEVKSSPGKGARVTARIPLLAVAAAPAHPVKP